MQLELQKRKETQEGGIFEEIVEKLFQIGKKLKNKYTAQLKGSRDERSSGTLGRINSTKTHTLAHHSHTAKN